MGVARGSSSLLLFTSFFAEIAQLVEHDLAKVGVASSSLVFRSSQADAFCIGFFYVHTVGSLPPNSSFRSDNSDCFYPYFKKYFPLFHKKSISGFLKKYRPTSVVHASHLCDTCVPRL